MSSMLEDLLLLLLNPECPIASVLIELFTAKIVSEISWVCNFRSGDVSPTNRHSDEKDLNLTSGQTANYLAFLLDSLAMILQTFQTSLIEAGAMVKTSTGSI